MRRLPHPGILGVVVAVVTLAACAGTGPPAGPSDAADPSGAAPTSTAPVVATTAGTTSAGTTTAGTTTAPPVSTTTAATTTTTLPPPTLFVEGAPMLRLAVEVGDGVEGTTRDEVARFVVDTLADPRSWTARGAGFELVDDPTEATVTFVVATPDDVDRRCAPLRTLGRYSCARNGWIAINSLRWFGATDDWPADLTTYRRYLVNHEIGHYLRGAAHDACPGPGQAAPITMQQTKGLDGCVANGWVVPDVPE